MDVDNNDGHDLIERFVEFTKQTFIPAVAHAYGMDEPHVGTVSVIPDELMPKDRDAFFTTLSYPAETVLGSLVPPGSLMTVLNVSQQTALLTGVFLEGRTPELPPEMRTELLALVKQNLLILAHEATHSLRVRAWGASPTFDPGDTGVHAIFEGLTQAVTEIRFHNILASAGIITLDPEIATAESNAAHFYVGISDAAHALIKAVAERADTTESAIADSVARRHFGRRATEYLVETYLTMSGVTGAALAAPDITTRIIRSAGQLEQRIEALAPSGQAVSSGGVATSRALGLKFAADVVRHLDQRVAQMTAQRSISGHDGLA